MTSAWQPRIRIRLAALAVMILLVAGCSAGPISSASDGRPSPSSPGVVAQPPPCLDAELHFDATLGKLLLANCVDQDNRGSVEQLWSWDGTSWALIESEGPDARVVAGIAFDVGRQTVLRYGGLPLDGNDCTTDMVEWDHASWRSVAASPPTACDHMKLVYDASTGVILLFGGQDPGGNPKAETWTWDGAEWSQVAADGPPFRAHFELVDDPAHEQVFLWGGYDGEQVFNDFWSWDGSAWTELDFEDPSARSHASMVVTPEGLLLFGGATSTSTFASVTDETWYLTNGRWSLLDGPAPSSRGMAAIGFDSERGVVVLYGGFNADGVALADTWEWDGSWRCVSSCG
jgi:hypothetical protein